MVKKIDLNQFLIKIYFNYNIKFLFTVRLVTSIIYIIIFNSFFLDLHQITYIGT